MSIDPYVALAGMTTTFYGIAHGEFRKTLLLPVAGYFTHAMGNYCSWEKAQEVGHSVFVGSLIAFPGASMSYLVYTMAGKTVTAIALATLAGAGITSKVVSILLPND